MAIDNVRKSQFHKGDWGFWGAFLSLNALFFLPLTILFWGAAEPTIENESWFLARTNYDLFRFNVEWFALMAIVANIKFIRATIIKWVVGMAYLLGLAYYVYEAGIIAFLGAMPASYNDYFLMRDGLAGLLQHFDFPWLLIIAGILAIVFAITALIFLLREGRIENLSLLSRITLLLLAAGGLLAVAWRPTLSAKPEALFSSLTAKFEDNYRRSAASYAQQQIVLEQDFSQDAFHNPYDYAATALIEKPTIYLIFIESYGDVLYHHPQLRTQFVTLADDVTRRLNEENWQIASILSWTPVYGGGSWLAYTTLLTGIHIDTEPLYNTIIDQTKEDPLFSLSRYLQSQGYLYNRLTPLPFDSSEERRFQSRLNDFYHYDTWLTSQDLGYVGPLYGWGPAPPDQYSLNFLREFAGRHNQPSFNFYITHNSHAPWGTQPALSSDWRAISSPEARLAAPDKVEADFTADSYFTAINYQMDAILDFILMEDGEDAIFILAGDHQPPRVASLDGSPYTPLHIISKNEALVEEFYHWGFSNEFRIDQLEYGMRHAGFLSMFLRSFVHLYGNVEYDALPPYIQDGIQFGGLPPPIIAE